MTGRTTVIASVSVVALFLALVGIWLLAASDESASGLAVLGASLSVLSIAGVVLRGEAQVRVPRIPPYALVGGLLLVIVALAAIAMVSDQSSGAPRATTRDQGGNSGPGSQSSDPAGNDAERLRELTLIYDALIELRTTAGAFPSTEGNIQTACNYPIDKLCALESKLGKQTFVDPRGEAGRFGYWYKSDGKTFTLFASMEIGVPPDKSCPNETHLQAEGVKNVYCLRSPEP